MFWIYLSLIHIYAAKEKDLQKLDALIHHLRSSWEVLRADQPLNVLYGLLRGDALPAVSYTHLVDRVTPLAVRISRKPMWVKGFHRWMLGVAAQWLGQAQDCACLLYTSSVTIFSPNRRSIVGKRCRMKSMPWWLNVI